MSKSSSVLCAAVAAVVACAFPASAEDITAAVRAAGKGTASLTDGFVPYTVYDANMSANRSFDGNHTEETGRLLINQESTQRGQEVWVRYDIADDFQPGMDIVVESFTFWYSICGGDQPRTPTWMRLEASETGDDDDWVVLAKNDEILEPFVWENRSDHFYTVPVPHARQSDYRHYRFVSSKNAPILTIHELVLNGRISARLQDLTWDGGEDGTWNATAANWKNGEGESVVWSPSARANIGATSVAVEGTLDVREIRFAGGSTLTGDGTLNLFDPARISISAEGTMAADVNDYFYGEDTAESCADGTRTTDYTYLPRSDETISTGKEVVWWENRRLANITGFKSATIYYSGDGLGLNKEHGVNGFVNNGDSATVWFYRYYSGADTDNQIAWLCAKVEFKQVGPDVTARLVKAGYAWINTSLYKKGQGGEIPYDNYLAGGRNVYDDTHTGSTGSPCGVKDILAITSSKSGLSVVNRAPDPEVVRTSWLTPDPTNAMVSTRVLYMKNAKVADILDFSTAILHYNADGGAVATPYHCVRGENSFGVQFQRMLSATALICVKVEFTQEGDDVYVQGLYARYRNGVSEPGFDFDTMTTDGGRTVFATSGNGYNLSQIKMPELKVSTVYAFNGAFGVKGKVHAIGRVNLAFGGVVAVSSADTFAETPLALTDGAALSVAAGIAAVTPKLTVTGAATLTFADGASLEAEDIDLSAAETVTVVAAEGAKWMKVGRTLTKDELRKFAPGDGFRAAQDADGYLFAERVPGIILIVR